MILSIFSYVNGGKKLHTPSFLVCITFCISSFYYMINIDFVGHDISFATLFVIVTGIGSWIFGENLARHHLGHSNVVYEKTPVKIPTKLIIIASLLSFAVTFGNYLSFMKIGNHLGGDSVLTSYALVRTYSINADMAESSLNKPATLKLAELISTAFSYLIFYYYLYNRVTSRKKGYFLYIIPFLVSLPSLFFTTSRQAFMEPVLFVIFLLLFFLYRERSKISINRKFIKWGIIILVVCIALFKISGDVRGGKIYSNISIMESIESLNHDLCVYVASPICGLDFFLSDGYTYKASFGSNTLAGIYDLLRFIGFTINADEVNLQQNFKIGPAQSNVYSGFKGIIEDFTLLAYIPYVLFIGYFCGFLYRKFTISDFKHSAVLGVFVAKLYVYICLFYFSDLFHILCGTTTIIYIVSLVLINKYIIKIK